jgi:hypothetical protein
MAKLKLFQSLGFLDFKALQDFRVYLLQHLGEDNQHIRTYDFVLQGHPTFDNEIYCSTESIALFLFGKQAVAAQKQEQAMDKAEKESWTKQKKQAGSKLSTLMTHLKDFLTLRALDKDPFLKDWLLMNELIKLGHSDLLIETAENLLKAVEVDKKSPFNKESTVLFAQRMLLHSLISTEVEPRKKNSNNLVFEQYANAMKHYTTLAAIKLACEMDTLQGKAKNAPNPAMLEDLLAISPPEPEQPILKIYQVIHKLVSKGVPSVEADEYFNNALELFKLNANQFAPSELERIATFLMNYCIAKINEEELQYRVVFIDIIKVCLDNHAYRTVCSISPNMYVNYVNIACVTGNLDEAKYFIKEYYSFLNFEFREDVVLIANATVYFFEKNYSLVSKTLSMKTEFKHIDYELRRRVLLIQSTFEDNSDNRYLYLLFDLLSSFEKWLERCVGKQQISNDKSMFISGFIKILKMILLGKDKEIVSEEITKSIPVLAHDWLKKHVENLK